MKYNVEKDKSNRIKLNELKSSLPEYTYLFLDEKSDNNPNTAVAYARDLLVFFEYLKTCKYPRVKVITIEKLEKLTFKDINKFQHYLDENHPEINKSRSNGKCGIARKMASLRGFFEYQVSHNIMSNNPCIGTTKVKINTDSHTITRLTQTEVGNLLNAVKNTDVGSFKQRKCLEKTKLRDYAIMTLLLNTGIRVSECVGLDLDDLNFNENSMKVFRKGKKQQVLYFNDDVASVLMDYIENERINYSDGSDNALFLSSQKKRIAVRTIQDLVKKYSVTIQGKNISPHKMRSTYGTALYNQTGDIRLVADVLGHKDINTTSKHYAAMDDERRRKASTIRIYD